MRLLKYKNTIKTTAKILLYLLTGVVSFLFTITLIVYNPLFQSFAVKMVSDYFSRQTGMEIKVGGFALSFTRGLVIRDLSIKDKKHADLFAARRIGVIPGNIHLRKHKLGFAKISIDQGVIQLVTYKNDSILNLQYLLDYFSSGDTTGKNTTPSRPWDITISRIELSDTRFHLEDENQPKTDTGMDYSNIDVIHINLLVTDFHPEGDTINANIKRLSAVERSGFTIRSMSGEFHVGHAFLKAHHLKLVTNNSDLDLSFDFLYNRWNDYTDFLNKVKIVANISPSDLAMQDIGAFAPVLYPMKDKFRISGELKGSVSNFHAKNFRVAFGSDTRFFGNISANGLPNVEETFVDMNIKSFITNKKDIDAFKLPGDAGSLSLPDFLKNASTCDLQGNFTGFYNDFATSAKLSTEIGTITTDLLLRKPKGHEPLSYTGQVDVSSLHLGDLFNARTALGSITLRADINGKGLRLKDADLSMNIHIDSAGINDYVYRNIDIMGAMKDEKFNGLLNSKDPNLLLDFKGLVNFRDSLPSFDFASAVHYANLYALHLLARNKILSISTEINVKFTGSNIDNILGSIHLDNMQYIEGMDTIHLNQLAFQAIKDNVSNKLYRLASDFADADFSGEFSFKDMIPSLKHSFRTILPRSGRMILSSVVILLRDSL